MLVFAIGVSLTFTIVKWHYETRIDSLREQVSLYQVKLEVSSPNDAYQKFTKLKDDLNVITDTLRIEIKSMIEKEYEINENYSWLEPICVSTRDTEQTLRQILVYNLTGKELGIRTFSDPDYCQSKYQNSKEE